jgi:hypothetical protein
MSETRPVAQRANSQFLNMTVRVYSIGVVQEQNRGNRSHRDVSKNLKRSHRLLKVVTRLAVACAFGFLVTTSFGHGGGGGMGGMSGGGGGHGGHVGGRCANSTHAGIGNRVYSLAPWRVIAHLTFQWEASLSSAQRCYEKFMRRELLGVSYFYAIEENPGNELDTPTIALVMPTKLNAGIASRLRMLSR